MLPFLKNRDDGGGVGPIESIERTPDEEPEYGTLDAVAEDILHAVAKKDAKLLREALEALCDHVQDLDVDQDQETMEGNT